MSDNVIIFPNISEQKDYIDLKEATVKTGLKYATLYKVIVQDNEVGYCRFGRKIVVKSSDIENLMKIHFIEARGMR